jgi:aminoglycoside phosphotransferase (APT) family kinase protein
MKKSKELAIVKKLTNVNDENCIVLNEIGWTSRVYVVNNGEFVFKFLKSKKYQKELEHEINVLKLIKEHELNAKVPLINWVGEENAYVCFYGIRGKSLTTEVIDTLSEVQKRKVGAQIGLFLKKMHAIDYKGKNPDNESDEIEWFQKSFCKRKRTLKKHFSKNELDALEKFVTSLPQKSAKLGIEQVFCHNDLGYNNILLADNLEVGVIDFGDTGNYDKSYDFIGIEDDIMLDAAILAYGDDKVLREKVAIRRQLLPLMEMLFLIDRKDKEGIKICARKMRINLENARK